MKVLRFALLLALGAVAASSADAHMHGSQNEAVTVQVNESGALTSPETLHKDLEDLQKLLESFSLQPQDSQAAATASTQDGKTSIVPKLVEHFGVKVESICDALSRLEDSNQIPPEMEALVTYVKQQLLEANEQSKQVVSLLSQPRIGARNNSDDDKADDKESLELLAPPKWTGSRVLLEEEKEEMGHNGGAGHDGNHHHHKSSDREHLHQHYEKLRQHPKINKHFKAHEAMMTGDMDFVHRAMDDLKRHTGRFSEAETFSDKDGDENHRRLLDSNQRQCRRLVGCLEEWTLYDLVLFYYGPYVNDRGEIDDKVDVKDAAGHAGLEKHISVIRQYIKRVKNNNYPSGYCQTLLRQLHTNENKELFSIYHGPPVTKICRHQGTIKYVKLNEIRDKISPAIADNIFDDLVRCSGSLGDETFFNAAGPRVPISVLPDVHGKTRTNDGADHYKFQASSPMAGAHNGDQRIAYWQLEKYAPQCVERVNGYYKSLFNDFDPFIFKSDGASALDYPPVRIMTSRIMRRTYIGVGDDDAKPTYLCETGSASFTVCPSDNKVGVTSSVWANCYTGLKKYQVEGLFTGFNGEIRDNASTLTLGESVSVGLACAHAEKASKNPDKPKTAGWCCLDIPAEGKFFGKEYNCAWASDTCRKKAPVLAGFSSSACDAWSGTWCPYPRDCSELKTCITGEIAWAKRSNKHAYLGYLKTAPTIEDTNDNDICGDAREYFGFTRDYPLDDEICEDIQFLRNNRNFQNLDENYGSSSSGPAGEPPEDLELVEPQEPETLPEQFEHMQKAVDGMGITIWTLESVERISGHYECPSDMQGISANICASVKNVLVVIAATAVASMGLICDTLEREIPSIEDHQMMEIYYNVDAVFGNMEIMMKGINLARTDIFNLANPSRRLKAGHQVLGRFEGCDGIDQDNNGEIDECEEDISPPEIALPTELEYAVQFDRHGRETLHYAHNDQPFKGADEAMDYLRNNVVRVSDDCAASKDLELNLTLLDHSLNSCHSTIRAVPVHWCKGNSTLGHLMDVVVPVDHEAPDVVCGFRAASFKALSSDKKTLIIEEEEDYPMRLQDIGLYFGLEEECSDTVHVDVSVKSNEYADGLIAKALVSELNGTKIPKIFVSPSSCESQEGSFCVHSPFTKKRFYEISIRATDQAGWTGEDVCRVVVVPKEEEEGESNKELRGSSSSNLRSLVSQAEEETMFDIKTTERYVIDTVQFEWQKV
ncbi:expressed unknown protein [Seminavis robusta]|uniref:Uncharacterized protein n=1 Tax=Seminavis robusta TaxID=568900 RepID=A0A9N8HMX3_9STRA|nr:expressed unknown protein [Seminavis robusta]|eukprot:Sro938_g222370.1 n/a (1224) ;mRNA; f:35909-41142